jgi:hypothetical protein
MITVKFDKSRSFFDKEAVLSRVDAAKRKKLSRAGAMLRQTARRSMRRRKKPSRPGSPPSAHSQSPEHPRGALLKERLFFAYDQANDSVVVGPEQLGRSDAAPLQEFGGTVRTYLPRKTVKRKISAKALAALRRKRANGSLKIVRKPLVARIAKVRPRPFMGPPDRVTRPRYVGVWADGI